MFMFMTEKTYRFHSSLQQFISELMTEHDRLRAIYGDEHFTCYLGERLPDPLAMYIRPRKLIYWCNQKTSLEDHKVEMVTFYNLPSLDGENIKLRADILNEPALFDCFSALARWQETENLWISKGLMKERKDLLEAPLAPYQAAKKRGIQAGTKSKIKRLREIRAEDLEEKGSIRSRQSAMDEVKITDKTWRMWDRKTYDNWDVKSYKLGKLPKTE